MAYRLVVLWAGLLCACNRDTGILVSVTRDPATLSAGVVDHLQFIVAEPGTTPGIYVKRAADPDVMVDVTGRDLKQSPYKVLYHDVPQTGALSSPLMVAVLGLSGGTPIALAAFTEPQAFARDLVLERDLMLVAQTDGKDFNRTGGCLIFGSVRIISPDDPDCDGDPPTDCDDTDGGAPPPGCKGTECDQDSQCASTRGAPTCAGGGWKCLLGVCTLECGPCVDADLDGYGVGPGCLGPDCDDNDPKIGASGGPRSCYSGASGTAGMGVCRKGSQICTAGAWGPCVGEVVPSREACNNQDDDCNGLTDDGLGTFTCGVGSCQASVGACHQGVLGVCMPGMPAGKDACDGKDEDCNGTVDDGCGCVKVSLSGNDTAALGNNNATPFATLAAAVSYAAAGGGRPRVVCVANGSACGGSAAAYPSVSLNMASGIDVYGGYESTTWTRCAGALTTLQMAAPEGVVFAAGITAPTAIDGFTIQRTTGPGGTGSAAGITVTGAKNVSVSNVVIADSVAPPTSYGVDVSGGAQVLITRSQIGGGNGTTLAAGVHAVNSQVVLRQNCPQYDSSGACVVACGSGVAGFAGRVSATGGAASYAVLLDGAAGSIVEQNLICGTGATVSAGLRLLNDGTGVVIRQNQLSTAGGVTDSHGLWMEDCNNASPWVVDNAAITTAGANASTRADGVRAMGACHPVIDANRLIVGGSEGNAASVNGVHCGANAAGTPSLCTILGNDKQLINGSGGGFPPAATGVRCDDGACLRVERNTITGHSGGDAVGLALVRATTFVDRNIISGGCGTISATAVFTDDATARLQSNRLYGGACSNGTSTGNLRFYGLQARITSSGRELDVHSNDIDAGGSQIGCTGIAVELSSGLPLPVLASGVFRNNIILSSLCPTRIVFKEADTTADVRVLDHNDFDPVGAPQALFVDEGTTPLNSAAAINGLTDAQASGNLSGDAAFVSYPSDLHLQSSSLCIGAGSTVAVPIYDLDGRTRKSPPSIGAYEAN